MQRKICVVTGSRAEYGLLRETMRALVRDERVRLQVIATGMHLSPTFGDTFHAIEEDGFAIDARVDMLLASDRPVAVAKSVGLGTIGFADALERLRPELLVVLGDRFEVLAAAQAALLLRIPVAHVHGGEVTAGAVDDAIRHAITKMAHLHFVAAEPYRRRVIQLGEDPSRVFCVGAPGLDALRTTDLLDRAEVEARLGKGLGSMTFLVTYHPATLGSVEPRAAAVAMLAALDRFPEAIVVMTKPNADAHGSDVAAELDAWAARNGERTVLRTSLGSLLYLSVMRLATLVIGNSSSGIIEAPALGVPTVNIGPRQDGRLRARSVIDCAEDEDAIAAAIGRAISAAHRVEFAGSIPPYGRGGDASAQIAETLASFPLPALLHKIFQDVPT